jgi:isopentenyl-diphosphate delta-isomerase
LVDTDDQEIGNLSKAECHDGDGILHRAFSLFLFDDQGLLLLQKRSAGKRLWPKYWSNTCCSHPRQGESMDLATARRLQQELNTSAELEFIYKFAYQAQFADQGSENELCWVYLGRLSEEASANETERFTPWFRMEWQRLNEEFADRLAEYGNPISGKF